MMKPVSAVDGARKIVGKIASSLPVDARWRLEGRDGSDEMYYLSIYARITNEWAIREVARETMANLLEKGITLVLVFIPPEGLEGLVDGIETFSVREAVDTLTH
jgi:hypothetical protein